MNRTPWDEARTKQRYLRQEEELGTRGGKQINSGRVWYSKRDVVAFDFLEDAKTTNSKSFTIKVEDLKKLTKDAFFHSCLPALQIEFFNDDEYWTLMRKLDHDHFQEAYALLREEVLYLRERIKEAGTEDT